MCTLVFVLFGQGIWTGGHTHAEGEDTTEEVEYDPNRAEYYTPEFKAVAEQLHSQDKCSSLYACPSGPLARTAKDKIVTMLNEGKTTDEILDYFVENYGESILVAPRGANITSISAYAIPFLVIALVAAAIFIVVRIWIKKSGAMQAKESEIKLSENEAESDIIRQMIEDERKKFL